MLPARANPFESDRIERLLRFDPGWLGLTWDEILERAKALDFRGAIVGPHGSGKTTCCDTLVPRLESLGFRVRRWFLNDEKTRPDSSELARLELADASKVVLLIDGAEFLNRKTWRQVHDQTCEFAGILVTAHTIDALPKPRLPVLLETETRLEMLAAFVEKLAPDLEWKPGALDRIFSANRGNLREALWDCYDEVSSRSDSPE